MTIQEVAKILKNCANSNCLKCKFYTNYDSAVCQANLIEEMGREVRKIAEEKETSK